MQQLQADVPGIIIHAWGHPKQREFLVALVAGTLFLFQVIRCWGLHGVLGATSAISDPPIPATETTQQKLEGGIRNFGPILWFFDVTHEAIRS